MREKIIDILKYILREYPRKSELSVSRLTKIMYLVDWRSILSENVQVTSAKWYFNHYGPYVNDFIELASKDDDIVITIDSTIYGGKKKLVALSKEFKGEINIEAGVKKIVDFVIMQLR